MPKNILLILTFILFVICAFFGFREAVPKRVWTDEVYTYIHSVKGRGFGSILLGRETGEGNVNPLYYLIEKVVVEPVYALNPRWLKFDTLDNPVSRILWRIPAILFMAAGISLIFYYFSARFSLWWGIYSLFISFSTFMVWAYWAEARPYSLWFLLSAAQCLLVLDVIREGYKKKFLIALIAVHLLLGLTIAVSVIQIAAVSLLWLLCAHRKWLDYVGLWLIPSAIAVYYYAQAPKYTFWFKEGPLDLINASLPKDRMIFLFIFAVYVGLSWLSNRMPALVGWRKNLLQNKTFRDAGIFLGFVGLVLAGNMALMAMFIVKQTYNMEGFQLSNRYFMSLAPLGIIAVTLFSIYAMKTPESKLWKAVLILLLGSLVVLRVARVYGFSPIAL